MCAVRTSEYVDHRAGSSPLIVTNCIREVLLHTTLVKCLYDLGHPLRGWQVCMCGSFHRLYGCSRHIHIAYIITVQLSWGKLDSCSSSDSAGCHSCAGKLQ
eukprot:16711-Heterococcus_DN1.PRE.2